MPSRLKAQLMLLCAVALWGAAGPVIKYTLQGLEPFVFLSYRLAISAVVGLLLILYLRPKLPKNAKQAGILLLYGLLATTFSLGFIFLGLNQTGVLELGLIASVGPLLVVAGGALLLRERVSKLEKIGIAIAFSGTLFTVFSPVLTGAMAFKFGGNILILLHLVSDTSAILLAKSMMRHHFKPVAMTNMAFIIGAATIVPATVFMYGAANIASTIATLPLKYHLGVWYMAIFSGTIAFFLFIRGERTIEAGRAALFFYLSPIISIPLAVLWLGESITLPFIVGAAIIGTGVYIAEKKNR